MVLTITRKNKTLSVNPDQKGLYESIGYFHNHFQQADQEWKPLGRSNNGIFVTLPGMFHLVTNWLNERGISYIVNDQRTKRIWDKDNVDIESQREAGKILLDALEDGENGILLGPCGVGKTHVIKGIIQGTNVEKVLITTEDTGAAEQLYNDLRRLLPDSKIGIFYSRKKSLPCPITIVTSDSIKSLAANQMYIDKGFALKDFQMWIADEVHTLPTPSILASLPLIHAPIRYGLTATLKRKDGAHAVIEGYFGKVLAEITHEEGVTLGNVAPVKVFIFPVPYIKSACKLRPEDKDWRIPVLGLAQYKPLHFLIAEIAKMLPKDGSHIIFAQWEKYCKRLQKNIPKSKVLHGKMPLQVIYGIKQQLKTSKDSCIIATDLIQKAFDAPSVKYITMAALGSSADKIQRAGRATRVLEGKEHAQLHDFLHLHHPILFLNSLKAIEEYSRLGWKPRLLMSKEDIHKLTIDNPILGQHAIKLKQLEEFCEC